MRKGNLVKLNSAVCFTERNGGEREFPLINGHCDDLGIIRAARPVTRAETEAWYNSDAAHGMNSAGESKLPPQSVLVEIGRDDVLVVERARCRVRLGYGNATGGYTQVITPTGETAFIKRELLEVAG
tara:strand:+ start:578 stop:958 length:381 start_codon:yes stop_codon:yes gene_type:complete